MRCCAMREKKPVVASLGGVAASGGYYVASGCDVIVANPGTLTGSIGVILQTGNVSELLKKVGIQGVIVKAGKFKDIGSPLREMSEEEKRLLDDLLQNVHTQFIAAVSKRSEAAGGAGAGNSPTAGSIRVSKRTT